MSSRPPPVAHAAGEEVSELGASGASVVTVPKVNVDDIKTVWELEKVERQGGPDDLSKYWLCGWCGKRSKGWNATKVMVHLARLPGNNDVKACVGPIPKDTLDLFRAFRSKKVGNNSVKRKKQEAYKNSVSENQQSLAVAWEGQRVRSSLSSGRAGTDVVDCTMDSSDVAVSNSAKLTTAIAEFVYCTGLPFTATEGAHFLQVLKLSRLVPSSYRPPTRKVLSNELLEVSYQSRIDRYMSDLSVDSNVYGLSLFGDGAIRFMGCH